MRIDADVNYVRKQTAMTTTSGATQRESPAPAGTESLLEQDEGQNNDSRQGSQTLRKQTLKHINVSPITPNSLENTPQQEQ